MPSILDSIAGIEFEGGDVLSPPPRPKFLQFRHRTIGGRGPEIDNIEFPWYWTRLDHEALNGKPNAIVTVTPVGRIEIDSETRSARLIQNPHPVGVLYRSDRWYIYNLGLEAMEINADFNVAVHKDTEPG